MPSSMIPGDSFEPTNSAELLQHRARQVADQSLASTRRMVTMCNESKEIGLRTLVTLDDQGEKLDLVEERNNEIRAEMKQAEQAITDMEKCCGIFVIPWRRPKNLSQLDKEWKKISNEDGSVVSTQPQKVTQKKEFSDGFVPRITNDEGEEEMSGNLAHVHSTVGNLKNMAADINAEVKAHNRQLDKLKLKADSNDLHVQAAAQRTENLPH